MHETFHKGHRPAFPLQRFRDGINLPGNVFRDQILQKVRGVVARLAHEEGIDVRSLFNSRTFRVVWLLIQEAESVHDRHRRCLREGSVCC